MPEGCNDATTGVLVWAPTASDRRALVEMVSGDASLEVHGAAPTVSMVVKRVHLHEVDVVLVHTDVPAGEVDEARERLRACVRFVRVPSNASNVAALVRRHSRRMKPLAARHTVDAEPLVVRPKPPEEASATADRGTRSPPSVATEVVCISTSTGGPKALSEVLRDIPADFPLPVLIMQHIPEGFAEQLADNLTAHCPLPVRVGVDGEEVRPGVAWLAPGDFHMGVFRDRTKVRLRLTKDPKLNNCRPAGDFLLDDAVRVWGPAVLSVVLTGMGRDAEDGSRKVRDAGGMVIAQDEATSVVWGMPGAVARSELAHQILPLDEIAHAIIRRARRVAQPRSSSTSDDRRIAS